MLSSLEKPKKMAKIIGILTSRQFLAHMLMMCFVVLPSVGVAMLYTLGAGLIVAGASAGVYGYLLGRD